MLYSESPENIQSNRIIALIKSVDLSHYPVELEGGRFLLKCNQELKNAVNNVPSAADYTLYFKEKDGTNHALGLVQSFKFEVNVKDNIPKFTVDFVDFVQENKE